MRTRLAGRRLPAAAPITPQEHALLTCLRELGYDIRRAYLDGRAGATWIHPRVIVKGVRSWSHSID